MHYWLVRSKWNGENKKVTFINNEEWINGYKSKYLEVVNRVEEEDVLLLAEESIITHYGICSENYKDGRHLLVDKWILLKTSISFTAKGSYIKTIVKIKDNALISSAKFEIEKTSIANDIKIKEISIENFTVFKNEKLKFSEKLNIIIGENSTGKSHLLKLLYVFIIANNSHYPFINGWKEPSLKYKKISEIINQKLLNVFKPDALENLVNKESKEANININLMKYSIDVGFNKNNTEYEKKENQLGQLEKKIIFIPAKETLSFYEGFIALYENREISFDETYYNLAKALGLLPLKNIESYPVESKLLCKLEKILEGKILLERGRFYLVSNDKKKTEISLIAEGLRKIGTISHLIANGSLNKNSILIWDEPESNLNPKLIKKIAEILVELGRSEIQVFIATHSLFLVKEIEILRKEENEVKYFGLGFYEKEIRVSQSENFEYLDNLVILDEEFEQDDRFMSKED